MTVRWTVRAAKGPTRRETLAPQATEGERVTMKVVQTYSHAGSFRHASQRTPKAHFIRFGEPLPRATFLPEEGFLLSPVITHIGRENNISADIYMCIRRGDLRSPAGEHSSPLPCSENILMRTCPKRTFLLERVTGIEFSGLDAFSRFAPRLRASHA